MHRTLLLLALTACGFQHGALNGAPDAGDDAPADGPSDAPPTTSLVKFTSITTTLGSIKPGAYGWQVTAVLRNDLPNDITNIRATLAFSDGTNDRAGDFRWRDIDMRENVATLPPAMLAAGSETTFKFVVDALPWLMLPGPILINGAATFDSVGTTLSATPSTAPASLPFAAMNAPILVNTLTDENNTGNTVTSLREAILQANQVGGLDHIIFDPAVFTANSVATLSNSLGELPTLDGGGGDIVIDGTGADVTLALDTNWIGTQKWPFRITGGNVAIANIGFKNFGYAYPVENVSTNNCGNGDHAEGGAIRIEGGTSILEKNKFNDVAVTERNCYASLLRYEGGTNHRIINNHWTNQSQDSMYINANVREITGNNMEAGNDLTKVDECIYINAQGNQDTWITGNLCSDMEYSGVIADGSDAGKLYIINNTFARDGRVSLSAVRRGSTRQVIFKNNFYISNNPSAVAVNNTGTGFDFDHETLTNNPLCDTSCSSANQNSTVTASPSGVLLETGTTFADFTPQPGSALLDSGATYIDRNGKSPGHFNGSATDRGAVEAP